MTCYDIIPAEKDWGRYINIYNRATVYAPYTIPLSQEIVDNHIVPFRKHREDFAIIGSNGKGEGIIHVGKQKRFTSKDGREDSYLGLVYVLLADNNDIAHYLLKKAEEWFKDKGLSEIWVYRGYPNPYTYIMHGSEVYCWGGAYPAINAFRRQEYDIAFDIVVMLKKLDTEPEIILPDIDEFELKDTPDIDNDLVKTGIITALVGGKEVGYCGYQYLKAVSKRFNKGIGQINIGTNSEFHGKGVGRAVITCAHNKLYKLGARQVILATNQQLFRAIKFYQKIGYNPEPIRAYSFTKDIF